MISIDFVIAGTKYPYQKLHGKDAELLSKVLYADSGSDVTNEVLKMISSKNEDVAETINASWQEVNRFMTKDEKYLGLFTTIEGKQNLDFKMIADEIAQNLGYSYRYIGRVVKVLIFVYMLYGEGYLMKN